MHKLTTLPTHLTVRAPRDEDAAIVVDLIVACQRADGDEPDMTVEELLKDWHGVDLDEEAVLILGPEGNAVGYADILTRRYMQVNVYAFVLPGPHWETVWSYLVTWGEDWARAHAHLAEQVDQVSVYHFIHANNRHAHDRLTASGYTQVRTHYIMEAHLYIMEAHLDSPPPSPAWPGGIAVRTFQSDEDGDAFFEAGEAAFQDSWNRPSSTKERWLQPAQAAGFDPTLWFLPYALNSGQIAGMCLCSIVAGVGMVDTLGVRRSWRRQGLGLAMLRHAFGEFWRRGVRTISLNVDAGSPTGAPRLYERAGFKVQSRIHRYEKKVQRPGP